ncbi:hypothetical protein HID58_025454 [Brassica napus]|uniref:(rape) hypothetical protein n=1 Tax=Brassica napus TaxID=3708 RepID=A0A816YE36_BRANA|nr:hypothetical protein HID58_025454 [Brassica napus]CAF2159149.1 unnamed protein product [Brassica napus]
MQLMTRTMFSFITTIKYGLLSWIRRELSCKSEILPDKSDSGLSQLISLRFDFTKSQILLLDRFFLQLYMHYVSFLTMVGTCNTHLCGFFLLQHSIVEPWEFRLRLI